MERFKRNTLEHSILLFCHRLEDLELDSYLLRGDDDRWRPTDALIREIRALTGANRQRVLPGLVMIALALSKSKAPLFRAVFDRNTGKRRLKFNAKTFITVSESINPISDHQQEWQAAIEACTTEDLARSPAERFRLIAAFTIVHFTKPATHWLNTTSFVEEIQKSLDDPFLQHCLKQEEKSYEVC